MARKRYLVLSDIHSNEQALQAVFSTVKRRRYESVLCMGDLVGYGGSPNAVLSRLRRLPRFAAVRGNHDKVCIGIEDGENFNGSALKAAKWTAGKLTRPNRDFLARLPKGPREVLPGVWIAHGSFVDEDTYMFSDFDAYQAFEAGSFKVCFFGHTHYPVVYVQTEGGIDVLPLDGGVKELVLEPHARYLINPGSVGQPRDRDPRAGFAEFYPESRRVVFYRVEYDAEAAAQKIDRAGLPENLGNRLLVGT